MYNQLIMEVFQQLKLLGNIYLMIKVHLLIIEHCNIITINIIKIFIQINLKDNKFIKY